MKNIRNVKKNVIFPIFKNNFLSKKIKFFSSSLYCIYLLVISWISTWII